MRIGQVRVQNVDASGMDQRTGHLNGRPLRVIRDWSDQHFDLQCAQSFGHAAFERAQRGDREARARHPLDEAQNRALHAADDGVAEYLKHMDPACGGRRQGSGDGHAGLLAVSSVAHAQWQTGCPCCTVHNRGDDINPPPRNSANPAEEDADGSRLTPDSARRGGLLDCQGHDDE